MTQHAPWKNHFTQLNIHTLYTHKWHAEGGSMELLPWIQYLIDFNRKFNWVTDDDDI